MKTMILWMTALITFFTLTSDSSAYYMEVDSLSMNRTGSAMFCQSGADRYIIQQFLVTNTGATDLFDVGVAFTFMYSGNWGFDYNNDTHSWQREITGDGTSYGLHSLQVFTACPFGDPVETTYLSLSRDNTDLALCGFAAGRSTDIPLILDETDEIPVFWLGDLAVGESAYLNWYALQSPYISPASNAAWSFNLKNSFIAESRTTVPLAGSLWFLAGGLVFLRRKKQS